MNTLKKSLLTASIFINAMISILLPSNAQAADTSATAQLQQWSVQAGTPGNAVKGQAFLIPNTAMICHVRPAMAHLPSKMANTSVQGN